MATQPDQLREELVAYLDGELDETARVQIEERLARDEAVRRELTALQQAWDLLDGLPRSTVDEDFMQTTVEMVAVAAEQDAAAATAIIPRQRRKRWLIAGAAMLMALSVGFAVASWHWPDPNAALLRDLPVIENLESYRHAESVKFLHDLHDTNLFAHEEDEDAS